MKKIKLTQGKYALVDNEDFEELNKFKWYYKNARTKDKGYAARNSSYDKNGKRITIRMHRVILKVPKEKQIDHVNMDGIDNRKSNLRLANYFQNRHNRKKCRTNTSGYKGVTWNKSHQKWESATKAFGKRIYLGFYDSPIEAARVYDNAIKKFHGKYARPNFVSSL